MKHRIYSILALALFVLTGCVETEVWNKIDDDKNKVRLSVRTMSGVVSRAADTPSEERIDWIDVFVFNSDADQTLFHKERIDMSSALWLTHRPIFLKMKISRSGVTCWHLCRQTTIFSIPLL